MKCEICKKPFKEGDKVIPILRYVTNEKRGDFVTGPDAKQFLHFHHLKETA